MTFLNSFLWTDMLRQAKQPKLYNIFGPLLIDSSMFKRLLLLLSAVLFLSSCDNELDVNDDWSDITVVFGLLDITQDTNWVRIHRAWLGEDEIVVGAQSVDSLYYSQSISVVLDEIDDNGNVVKSITMDYDDQSRELNDGYFTTDGYHLYRTTEALSANTRYQLRVDKNNGNSIVTAETVVLEDDLNIIRPTPAQLIALADNQDYTVEFDNQEGSKVFQTFMRLRYKQHPAGNPTQLSYHTATVRLPVQNVNTTAGGNRVIVGWSTESFLNSIRQEVPFDANARRYVLGLDFEVLAGDEDLYTYINVNQPPTGIVTERPDYTNINGGYGIFASRALNGRYNKQFSEPGLLNLVLNDLTCDRNFVRITTTDTCLCNTGNLECQ